MKLHRFIDSFDLKKKILILSEFDMVHQLIHVLRAKTGEEILLCDGKGNEARVEIIDIQKSSLEVKVLERLKSIPEATRKVTLYAAIIKGEHFEMIAQKAVEAGIFEIVPIITQRTVKLNLKLDRIQKIMKEAAEQSGRGFIPLIEEPITFKDALKRAKQHEQNYFCDFVPELLEKQNFQNAKSVSCFIGPEGGWDEKERELAIELNCIPVRLGSFTLRAETAAIVVSYLLCQESKV
jgi:16S rRNA (uracil1498-N3)-methyltransferase